MKVFNNNDDIEGKAVRKRTKKERKRTNLGPRIKVLRLVTGEESEPADQTEVEENKSGVKVRYHDFVFYINNLYSALTLRESKLMTHHFKTALLFRSSARWRHPNRRQ